MSLVGKKYQYKGASIPPYEVVAEFSHNDQDRVVFLTQYGGYTTCSTKLLSENWTEVKPELKVGDWFSFETSMQVSVQRQVVGFWDGALERYVICRYERSSDLFLHPLSWITSRPNFEIL